jgi:hypothetical protein
LLRKGRKLESHSPGASIGKKTRHGRKDIKPNQIFIPKGIKALGY